MTYLETLLSFYNAVSPYSPYIFAFVPNAFIAFLDLKDEHKHISVGTLLASTSIWLLFCVEGGLGIIAYLLTLSLIQPGSKEWCAILSSLAARNILSNWIEKQVKGTAGDLVNSGTISLTVRERVAESLNKWIRIIKDRIGHDLSDYERNLSEILASLHDSADSLYNTLDQEAQHRRSLLGNEMSQQYRQQALSIVSGKLGDTEVKQRLSALLIQVVTEKGARKMIKKAHKLAKIKK